MRTDIELLQALFQEDGFAKATEMIAAEKVYRVEIGGLRHYRRESGRVYKSLTTFLDAVMPANRYLQAWRDKMIEQLGSAEKTREFVQMTADYGTALHIAIAEYCRNAGVDWQEFEEWAFGFLSETGIDGKALGYALNELTNDFASLLAFFHDYEVKVIAVEIPVWLDNGVATLIDLVVEMNAYKYTEKTEPEKRSRVKAIINLKSGKKGFYETHVLQLVGERRMFNEVYGEVYGAIERVYNLAPNDWRTEPTYKIKDQTTQANDLEPQFSLFLEIGKERGVLKIPETKYPVFFGRTEYGGNPLDQLKMVEYNEYTAQKIKDL